MDDVVLGEHMVDRMYDVLADEEQFREHDYWIGRFAGMLDQSRPYTTREFLYLLGQQLAKEGKARRYSHRRREGKSAALLPGDWRQFNRYRNRL